MKLLGARHGETTWNVEKRLLGHTPGELTDRGVEQAQELARHVQSLGDNLLLYVSDLRRAAETAEVVLRANPKLHATYTPALRERNFGELEGRLISEVEALGLWELPDDDAPYNAESMNAFTRRIAAFVAATADKSPADSTALLLCHIGVLNRLHYLTDPEHFEFVGYPNADVTEFDFERILRNSQQFLAQHP